jgi:hypothetical protein
LAIQLASQLPILTIALFRFTFFALPVVVSSFQRFIMARMVLVGLVLILALL